MAGDKIRKEDIIEPGLFDDAIKGAQVWIDTAKAVEKQQIATLESSKELFIAFKADGSKSLIENEKLQQQVNKTLREHELLQKELIKTEQAKEVLEREILKTTQAKLKAEQAAIKEIEKAAKAQKDANSEYKQASNALNILAKRVKDNSIAGRELSKTGRLVADEFENLKTKIDAADHSAQDFRRNVGNYPKQLKELQRELQKLEPGTEQFNKLAAQAGKLKDAIGDAKDATKAFATESKATTAKTLIGQIGSDIADLDFKGAAEKAGQFASVVKSISLNEIIDGFKALGSSILSVGKALLLNPLTLIVAGAAAGAAVIYDYVKAFQRFGEVTEDVNAQLEKTRSFIDELSKKQETYALRLKLAFSNLSKEQKKQRLDELENTQERKAVIDEFNKEVEKLELTRLENSRGFAKIDAYRRKQEEITFNTNLEKLKITFGQRLIKLKFTQDLEQKTLQAEAHADELDKEKKHQVKKAKVIGGETDEIQSIRVNQLDTQQEFNDKAFEKDLKFIDMEAALKNNAAQQELDKRKEDRAKNLKEIEEGGREALNILQVQLAKQADEKQKAFDKEISDADKNIERQRALAEKGLNNTLAFEEANKVKLEQQKEAEKKKEIQRQEVLAFFKLFASYAEKDPNGALQKALRDTLLAKAIAGGLDGNFIEGTENVARDLKGNKFKDGEDGYAIAVDGRERILSPEQNALVGDMSNPALAKLAYDAQNGKLMALSVAPSNDFSKNIVDSAALQQLALQTTIINELREIKNKPVHQSDFSKLGEFIETTIINGNKEIRRHKINTRLG